MGTIGGLISDVILGLLEGRMMMILWGSRRFGL